MANSSDIDFSDEDFALLQSTITIARDCQAKSVTGLVNRMVDCGFSEEEAKRGVEIWRSLGRVPDPQEYLEP